MEAVRKYLKSLGYNLISKDFYDRICSWMSWYSGKVPSFHEYNQFNGKKTVKRSRYSLGMSKKVCEDWADLLLNERMTVRVTDKEADEFLKKVLDDNNFSVRSNRLVEITFAMGTGAFVEYFDKNGVAIDYIRADMIYPLSWENGEIIECAFAGEKVLGGKKCIYLNMHLKENGCYKIVNKLFEKGKYGTIAETELPDGLAEVYYTGSKKPLFQIITPNIVNNFDTDNPMGISVFANAIDVLQGIDLVYDSYQNEFRLGKKRILIPAGMAYEGIFMGEAAALLTGGFLIAVELQSNDSGAVGEKAKGFHRQLLSADDGQGIASCPKDHQHYIVIRSDAYRLGHTGR